MLKNRSYRMNWRNIQSNFIKSIIVFNQFSEKSFFFYPRNEIINELRLLITHYIGTPFLRQNNKEIVLTTSRK